MALRKCCRCDEKLASAYESDSPCDALRVPSGADEEKLGQIGGDEPEGCRFSCGVNLVRTVHDPNRTLLGNHPVCHSQCGDRYDTLAACCFTTPRDDAVGGSLQRWFLLHFMNRRHFLSTTASATASTVILSGNTNAAFSTLSANQAALPYALNSLEPFISAEMLRSHFEEHHAAHVARLKKSFETVLQTERLFSILTDLLSWRKDTLDWCREHELTSGGARYGAWHIRTGRLIFRRDGGGHLNHSLFWRWMAPPSTISRTPRGSLAAALAASFGSLETFKACFTAAALRIPEDGWAWLIVRDDGTLAVTTTVEEDNPLMKGVVSDTELGTPILGLDMAAHAYASQYGTQRASYINAWWQVVNWHQVAVDFAVAIQHSA